MYASLNQGNIVRNRHCINVFYHLTLHPKR